MIPIVSRLRSAERGQLSDVQNLYVRSQQTGQRVPLRQVSTVAYSMETEKIVRRDHFRTITVNAFPIAGTLPSQVVMAVKPQIEALAKTLPPGYKLTIAGEQEEQQKGFLNLAVVLGISVFAIYIALVILPDGSSLERTDSTITGTFDQDRTRSSTPLPSSPGIARSRMIRSSGRKVAMRSASSPDCASCTT